MMYEICLKTLTCYCSKNKGKKCRKKCMKRVWQNVHTWIGEGVHYMTLFAIFHNKNFKTIFRVLQANNGCYYWRFDSACSKRKLKSIKKREWKFLGKTANEVMDADSTWKREVCNTLEICRNNMRIILLMIKIIANPQMRLNNLAVIYQILYLSHLYDSNKIMS